MTDYNVFDGDSGEPTNGLTFEEARDFLNKCRRWELRDHAFGDRELTWVLGSDDDEVAGGHFGGGSREVWISEEHGGGRFAGDEARELSHCGRIETISRNDETGPYDYRGA